MSGASDPPAPARFATIDAVRGVAVMGILLMNIAAFAMPFAAYSDPTAWGRLDRADRILWAAEFVAVDGKMRGLFSMLFGASLLLVADRAEAAGRSAAAVHFRRAGWLLVIGLAHAFLIWAGDILTLYAVIGSVAWWFRRRTAEELFVLGVILIAFNSAASLIMAANGASFASDPVGDALEAVAYRGSYADALGWRLATTGRMLWFQLLTAGPETLGLMLLGMAALRSGFATGGWSHAAYRRTATLCLGLSFPPLLALALWCLRSGFDPRLLYLAEEGIGAPFRPVAAAGYAALVILWIRAGRGPVAGAVAAAGRMALSNYLATSLVCTTIFYGYGFGLYGSVGRVAQLGIAGAVMLAMPVWSSVWLGVFRYGPAEWLWRTLARGAVQPLRR